MARILDAARQVFASGDGSAALDKIAAQAGVGAATLYRHFPNRQTLARAVYERAFTTDVEPAVSQLASTNLPREVMFEVIERVVAIARRERGLITSLGALGEATTALLARHQATFDDLVARGQAAGALRADLVGTDLPHLLALFAAGAAALDVEPECRHRYIGLMLDGLRPQPGWPPLGRGESGGHHRVG